MGRPGTKRRRLLSAVLSTVVLAAGLVLNAGPAAAAQSAADARTTLTNPAAIIDAATEEIDTLHFGDARIHCLIAKHDLDYVHDAGRPTEVDDTTWTSMRKTISNASQWADICNVGTDLANTPDEIDVMRGAAPLLRKTGTRLHDVIARLPRDPRKNIEVPTKTELAKARRLAKATGNPPTRKLSTTLANFGNAWCTSIQASLVAGESLPRRVRAGQHHRVQDLRRRRPSLRLRRRPRRRPRLLDRPSEGHKARERLQLSRAPHEA
jgi:hypothetical protein